MPVDRQILLHRNSSYGYFYYMCYHNHQHAAYILSRDMKPNNLQKYCISFWNIKLHTHTHTYESGCGRYTHGFCIETNAREATPNVGKYIVVSEGIYRRPRKCG